MNNNLVAGLFIALAIVSLGMNGWFFYAMGPDPTGYASATASACVNKPPIPNVTGCYYATELTTYACTVGVFDAGEANNRTYLDNSTLFNITAAGLMTFYPEYGDHGTYPIRITVADDSGCSNSVATKDFVLTILEYPANDTLNITDTTQTNTTYKLDPVLFTANYSDVNNATPIVGAFCEIDYDYQNESSVTMTYNATTGYYEYNRPSGFLQGTYNYTVTCDGLVQNYGIIEKNETFTITNRPPYLFATFPNLTIQAGTAVSGYDLNDYFKDNDLDALTFTDTSTSVINIQITSLGLVTITPNPTIQGNYTVRFTASDGIDTVNSNPFIITVLPRTFPPPSSGGGGGGGGGGTPPPFCDPDWVCTEWDRCLTTGIQERSCTDLNNCSSFQDRPELVRDCEYVGTCTDNIKNCHDSICEVGIDCGGPCDACASCFDGIRNQNEEGVDCGGVCDVCVDESGTEPEIDTPSPIDQIPEDVRRASYIGFALTLLAIIALILASLFLHKNLFRAVARWASTLVAPPEHHVSEHAQYVIGVEVAYGKLKSGLEYRPFVATLADRTSELLSWSLGLDAELTFEEMRSAAEDADLSQKQIKAIETYTELLETALYQDTEVAEDELLDGARTLARELMNVGSRTSQIEEARTLRTGVKLRLLGQLCDALEVFVEHGREDSAKMLIEEADALTEGLKKADVLDRYATLRSKVVPK